MHPNSLGRPRRWEYEAPLRQQATDVIKKVEGEDVILYAGTKVTRGTGNGVVVAIGEETEYGKVLKQGWEEEEPCQFRLIEKKYLGLILLLLLAFMIQAEQSNHVFALTVFYSILSVVLLLSQNEELFKHLLVSNELKKLGRFDIQIRDMRAFKRVNDVDVICFDKTGVLTTRQMEVKNIYLTEGEVVTDALSAIDKDMFHWIKIACVLCNDVLLFEKLGQANPIDLPAGCDEPRRFSGPINLWLDFIVEVYKTFNTSLHIPYNPLL